MINMNGPLQTSGKESCGASHRTCAFHRSSIMRSPHRSSIMHAPPGSPTPHHATVACRHPTAASNLGSRLPMPAPQHPKH